MATVRGWHCRLGVGIPARIPPEACCCPLSPRGPRCPGSLHPPASIPLPEWRVLNSKPYTSQAVRWATGGTKHSIPTPPHPAASLDPETFQRFDLALEPRFTGACCPLLGKLNIILARILRPSGLIQFISPVLFKVDVCLASSKGNCSC